MVYWFGKIFIAPFAWLLMRPRIRGYRRLFFRGRGIIVSNHWSLPDPVLLAVICPRMIHFMAKKELFEKPFLRFVMSKLLFAFPVNRKHADMSSLKQAMGLLEKGRVFGIFPEGRRSVTGELDTLEKGAAFLALKTGAPIIPVYSDPRTYRKFRINMVVGEPIDARAVADTYRGKGVDVVTQAIADSLQRLRMQMEE